MTSDLDPHNDATLLRDLLLNRYRVEGMLGEGGLGRVVKAYDTRLKRTVAIKTLKRSLAATDPGHYRAAEDRFTREAEAGSRVGDHPNLVTVYDLVADAEGTQYLICQYVPGGTLADRIAQGPIPLTDALRLTTDAAHGLQAAHDAGIVHRDIKPSNIFLAADGHAQVGDFGIAQMDHLSNRTHATMSHPGTPLYMSPEQAQTTGYVRPDTDQYSLGLVLFEMLTGKAYKRLREREITTLLASQPTDVAALIRQMTAQHPNDRYDAMDDVIEAINSIGQRSPSVTQPIQEPAPALVSLEQPRDIPPFPDVSGRAPTPERATPYIPASPAYTYPAPPIYAPTVPDPSSRHLPRSPASSKPTDSLLISAQSQPIPRHPTRRAVLAGLAGLAIAGGTGGLLVAVNSHGDGAAPPQPVIASTPTTVPPTTIPRVGTTIRTLMGHKDWVLSVTFSPDGQTVATASEDDTVRLWHVGGGMMVRTLTGSTSAAQSVAFSPNGETLATGTGDNTVRFWKVADGTLYRTLLGHTGRVRNVAFSPDGQTLASGANDNTARFWRVADGMPLHTLGGHTSFVSSVAFSPDGQILATGSDDYTARLWRVADGTLLYILTGHTGQVSSVAFSPDSQALATASADNTARLWHVADGTQTRILTGHNLWVQSVAFSPDGQALATGSNDKTARLWNVPDGTPLRTLTGHFDWVRSVAFSPDGKILATASNDDTTRLWWLG